MMERVYLLIEFEPGEWGGEVASVWSSRELAEQERDRLALLQQTQGAGEDCKDWLTIAEMVVDVGVQWTMADAERAYSERG
jgi:hypothetical protein